MNGPQALTEFERNLINVRGIAASNAAWEWYRAEELPTTLDPKDEAKMQQAFEAGYAAAMDATRRTLNKVQSVALAEQRSGTTNYGEPKKKVLINGVWVTPR